MGGIRLQLLCGVRIELAVGSLPMPSLFGGEEEGVLQTRQLWKLEAEPLQQEPTNNWTRIQQSFFRKLN